jgi:hypothetical protein
MIDNELVIMDGEDIKLYEASKTLKIDDFIDKIKKKEEFISSSIPYGTLGYNYVRTNNEESCELVTVMEPRYGIMDFRMHLSPKHDKSSVGSKRRWKYPSMLFITNYNIKTKRIKGCRVYHLPNKNDEPLFDLLCSDEIPLYKVPFSNINYESNKICLPRELSYREHNIMDGVLSFYNSRFNRDLIDNIRYSLQKQPVDPTYISENNPEGRVTPSSQALAMKDVVLHPENYFDAQAENMLVQAATLYPKHKQIVSTQSTIPIIKYNGGEE